MGWRSRCRRCRTDNAYELTADLPGIDEKNIEVKLAQGGLTIKGEKKAEKEEKDKNYRLVQNAIRFLRRDWIELPGGVDADKIKATFKNGVLTVRLHQKPEAGDREEDRGQNWVK